MSTMKEFVTFKNPAFLNGVQTEVTIKSTDTKGRKNYSPIKFEVVVSENEKDFIKIFVRDNKVIAQAFKKGAEKPYVNAVAKCHPEDEASEDCAVIYNRYCIYPRWIYSIDCTPSEIQFQNKILCYFNWCLFCIFANTFLKTIE